MNPKKQDIKPMNSKGQYHGYQQWYWFEDNRLWIRGTDKNDDCHGYEENHVSKTTTFYIK